MKALLTKEDLMNNNSDRQIIEYLSARDEKALELIGEKYGDYIFRIAFNMLGDKADAEECRNDVLLALWNAAPDGGDHGSIAAFVATVARRISINRYNEKKRAKRIPSELTVSIDELIGYPEEPSSSDEGYQVSELAGQINVFLRGLNKANRFIFISRYYEAEPVENIARETGKSVSAVYKALKRIKKQLSAHLERNGYKL